jgi:primosomal protein N'
MYNYPYAATAEPEILYKKILSKEAIKMIHWMCYTYYTPYKSVIKYFLSQDWELLLKREKK